MPYSMHTAQTKELAAGHDCKQAEARLNSPVIQPTYTVGSGRRQGGGGGRVGGMDWCAYLQGWG